MSVVTSREEREAAQARVAETPTEALQRDLVDWTISAHRSAEDFHNVGEQLARLRDLHAEEETWIELIVTELAHRRRPRAQEPIS